MTPVLVDTSALYSVLDRDDPNHERGAEGWNRLLDGLETGTHTAVSHSGVLIECVSLVQRRLGLAAVRVLHRDVLGLLDITWIGPELHDRATTALLAAGQRNVSLVDWISFELMRAAGIRTAFAFDEDFESQGFTPW